MADMAIVACEGGENLRLELAYGESPSAPQDDADRAHIHAAVERASRALDGHKTIRGNHTAAKKAIDHAVCWTDQLVGEVRAAIDILGQAHDHADDAQAA